MKRGWEVSERSPFSFPLYWSLWGTITVYFLATLLTLSFLLRDLESKLDRLLECCECVVVEEVQDGTTD